MQIVKFSDVLDRAFVAAFQRNYDAAGDAPFTWGGDGINEIELVDEILVEFKKQPAGTPLYCVEGNDGSQFAFFWGTEAQILAQINAIQ